MGDAVDLDAQTLIVSDVNADGAGVRDGRVYVLRFTAASVTQEALLTSSKPVYQGGFGASLAVSGDIAVIGAPNETCQGLKRAGAVYIFERLGGSWSLLQRLVSSVPAQNDLFGSAVAMDGDRIVVTAPNASASSRFCQVFVRGAAGWDLEAVLTPGSSAVLGGAVAIQGDEVFVGRRPPGERGLHMFRRAGASWTETQVIVPEIGGLYGQFGGRIAVDGPLLACADFEMDDFLGQSGGVLVYRWSGAFWKFHTKMRPDSADTWTWCGYDADVSGSTLVMGCPFADVGAKTSAGHPLVAHVPPPLGQLGCGPAVPNSSGKAGRLLVSGSASIADTCLRLDAIDLPTIMTFGFFLASQTPGLVHGPGSSVGDLCLAGKIYRLLGPQGALHGEGALSLSIAIPAKPPIQAGETWYFQCWFRDVGTSNFTSSAEVLFQ